MNSFPSVYFEILFFPSFVYSLILGGKRAKRKNFINLAQLKGMSDHSVSINTSVCKKFVEVSCP